MHKSLSLGVSSLIIGCALVLPHAVSAAIVRVNVIDNQFIAKTIDISPGDTVLWVNNGSMSHTVTADNGSFDSGSLAAQAQYSQLFTQPGSYPYYCKFHGGVGGQGMSGLIRVNGAPLAPVPVSSSVSSTAGDNSGQIAALLAQIVQLQQLIANIKSAPAASSAGVASGGTIVPTGSGGSCPQLSRVLKSGMSGRDVGALQQFLARDSSVYPEAQVSGYFGALTKAAVQRWQAKYGVASGGTPETTGFGIVGPATRAAIALQCSGTSTSGGSSTAGGTPTNAPIVGGFIQVTPITGNAPLTVSVNATINTVNSCQAAQYVLDWGDGAIAQQIPVAAGTCATLQQTYTHTYNAGGQYAIKLSAGDSAQSVSVSVNGPGSAPGGTISSGALLLSSPTGGQNYAYGQAISIAWKSTSVIPAGSTIVFDLFNGNGQKVSPNDVIAITSYPTGSMSWTIPTGSASQACPAVYPGGLCGLAIPTGSYHVHAIAYAPSTQGNTYGTTLATADSGTFTIIANAPSVNTNYSYGQLVVVRAANKKPLSATASFDLGTSCELYNIAWGDGAVDSNANTQSTGGGCVSSPVTVTLTHTYASSSAYTITLQRGASFSHVDSIGYTVSN